MKRKIWGLALGLALCLGLLTVGASAAEPATSYGLTVGGVVVTDANKNDILSDAEESETGSVSYVPESNALILNNAAITGSIVYNNYTSEDPLGIVVIGNNTVDNSASTDSSDMYGITVYYGSGLLITSAANEDTGTLTVKGGNMTLPETRSVDSPNSCGIYVSGALTIGKANVSAYGGNVTVDTSYATAGSYGIYVTNEAKIKIEGDGSLTAQGGEANGYEAYSFGICYGGWEEDEPGITVEGKLTATGGKATGTAMAGSAGIYIDGTDMYVQGELADVTLNGGAAIIDNPYDELSDDSVDPDPLRSYNPSDASYPYSCGLRTYGGNLKVMTGSITVTTGSVTGPSTGESIGLYLLKDMGYGDDTPIGGNITISQEKTTVNIDTTTGQAIRAEGSITIDDRLSILRPEGGSVGTYKTVKTTYDTSTTIDTATIVKADGKTIAPDVTIGAPSGASVPTVFAYPITVEENTRGDVTSNYKWAVPGTLVTITVKPGSGYTLSDLQALTGFGSALTLTDKGDGIYTFVMPASPVTVKSAFSGSPFSDVPPGSIYEEPVNWAVDNGITTGTGDGTTFSPDLVCTRAQAVTFLWRMAGCPEPVTTVHPFTDVDENAWYYKAMLWAVENKITKGTGDGTTFSPDMLCTRAQAVTLIYRYAQLSGGGFTGAWMFQLPFTDVPDWAYEPVAWCYMKGITNGVGGSRFGSDALCTRGQLVTLLYRFAVKPLNV